MAFLQVLPTEGKTRVTCQGELPDSQGRGTLEQKTNVEAEV